VVTYPPDFDPKRRYPLVLMIHGGPWFSSRAAFVERIQLLAAQGWIVFQPNYRGSDNFGNAAYAAIYRDHGAGPGRDVMAGLETLKARGVVDTARIGVSGWSYGGYMTAWLIGHYPGWKAALAGAAVLDLTDNYALNDLDLTERAYGPSLTLPADRALLAEQSPATYVDAITTPLLLMAATGDTRVPVTQSYRLFRALKERGRDVQLLLYPVSDHVPDDPVRARDIDRRWVEWFAERLR
jgi:dipeptidyl aminopeptidase/acylaminoacyl peptidase